jgi:putative intracellular protease/amidase
MKAYLYVLDTLADWEIAFISAEFNSGRYLDIAGKAVPIIKLGFNKKAIITMGGLTITPDNTFDNVKFEAGDLLILPGGSTWMDDENQEIIKKLPQLIKSKVIIAAICGATVALATNGLLDFIKHTSNDKEYLKMICPEYKGEHNYVNQPAVTDGNIITASGLAPMEFSYEVFRATGLMKKTTADAWLNLHQTRDMKYFRLLLTSIA